MDSDWNSPLKEINGINLSNYIPQKRSYNSVEFIHKKYFESLKPTEETTEKVKPKRVKKYKQDKSQQFSSDTNDLKDNNYKFITNNDNSVLEQTIKFAKNIVPLVIPPNEDKNQVFYTIKTSKKYKKKEKKTQESNFEHHIPTHERDDSKKIIETFKRVKKESSSVKESISRSDNTLDDLNNNQSISCTLSEVESIPKKKVHKKDKTHIKRSQKFAVSESFEAVAMETTPGDALIKIHLMNEKEKHFLSESIKEPVLNAIRGCLTEFSNNNLNIDITSVQKLVKCNSEKLDHILDKLTSIENKLDNHEKKLDSQKIQLTTHEKKFEDKLNTQESKLDSQKKKLSSQEKVLESYQKRLEAYDKEFNTYMNKSVASDDKKVSQPKVQNKSKPKASTLENLGEDLIDIEEEYSSEVELHQESLDRRNKSTVVVELEEENKADKKMESLGGGEVPSSLKAASSIGTKLERPNRIPARFCWTDAARKN